MTQRQAQRKGLVLLPIPLAIYQAINRLATPKQRSVAHEAALLLLAALAREEEKT